MTATVSTDATTEAHTIAEMLSERLETLTAHIVPGMLSSGYADEQWNGRLLVALTIRDEFQGVVDRDNHLFVQEGDLMRALEDRTNGAIAWDETGYIDLRGPFTEGHYLLDANQTWLVRTVISEIPKVTNATRQRLHDELSAA